MSKVLTMCPGCTSKIRVPDKYLGQNISCPKCQGIVLVQDIEAAETEPEDLPHPVAKAPAKPVARSAPPPIPRAVAPAAKAAPPARPRKPAPVEVLDDFEEVPDDDLFEEIDEDDHPPSKQRGLPPKTKKKSKSTSLYSGGRSSRKSSSGGMNGGLMIKGGLMIVGAIVWFVVGWMAGFIYFYPPVLLVIGIGTCIKAMMGSDE